MNAPQKSAAARPRRFAPARWSIFGFRWVPLLVFALGSWAALYGALRHRIVVTATHDEEITVAEPAAPDLSSLVPGIEAPPPMKFVKRIKTIKTASGEAETVVNVAVTVGQLTRSERGEIVRTASTAGPGYCPT